MPKIVYIGNDKWYRCLECLVGLEGVDIVHVFIPKKSPKLIELCENNNYDFTFVKNINEHYQLISKMYFDLFVVMGHQFLLKEDLLRLGEGIGFHPSMLPRRRGRAPINWAIIDGLEEMGVSLFYLDKGVDNGNIIFQSVFPITDKDTAASLIIKISELVVNNLPALLLNWPDIPEITQDENQASYTVRRNASDGEITTNMTALEAERLVRALNGPYPSAYIVMENGEKLYINEASINEFD